jgi:predicted nucleic acid-binding protein
MDHLFLDTNIILRFLTGDDLKKQAAAAALFARIEKKELTVYAPDSVICDAVFVLVSPRHYNKSHEEIRDLLFSLVSLENLKISNRRVLLRALDIFAAYPIDFSDAFLKATMEADHAQVIYSYDTDFDRFPDITRKEPEETEESAA